MYAKLLYLCLLTAAFPRSTLNTAFISKIFSCLY